MPHKLKLNENKILFFIVKKSNFKGIQIKAKPHILLHISEPKLKEKKAFNV